MTDIERFMSRIKVVGECWEWQRALNGRGYGKFKVVGRQGLAHRFAYAAFNGPVEDGIMVCHSCDNRKCANPAHLFLGTAKDNYDDMVQKGRARNNTFSKGHIKPVKLTREKADSIRSAAGNHKDIANLYGISRQMVSLIKLGKAWA